jgi:hypothetical protein
MPVGDDMPLSRADMSIDEAAPGKAVVVISNADIPIPAPNRM